MDGELLHVLSSTDNVDSYEYARKIGKDHQLVVGAVKRLESLGDVSLLGLLRGWLCALGFFVL